MTTALDKKIMAQFKAEYNTKGYPKLAHRRYVAAEKKLDQISHNVEKLDKQLHDPRKTKDQKRIKKRLQQTKTAWKKATDLWSKRFAEFAQKEKEFSNKRK
jgi:DNA-binding transcriptional regulator GbsR (MarR family)